MMIAGARADRSGARYPAGILAIRDVNNGNVNHVFGPVSHSYRDFCDGKIVDNNDRHRSVTRRMEANVQC
jgi:hypothetical protein